MAISAPPRPMGGEEHVRTSEPKARFRLRSVGHWLLGVGALATLAGAGLDAQRHLADPTLAHHEAVVSYSNPAHALLVSGIGAGGLGLFLVVAGPRVDRLSRRMRIGLPVAAAVAVAVALLAAVSSELGRAHGEASAAPAGHVHDVAPSGAPADAHDHRADVPFVDSATEQTLETQLAQARAAALQYPTVADALRAGFTLADPYSQGIGAHYMRYGLVDGVFDQTQPEMLLYAGQEPSSPVVGVMYYVDSTYEPAGFAGPYDVWHRHFETCLGPHGTRFSEDPEAVDCHHHGKNGWMLHAWVVPGWDSPKGVFAHSNPDLTCKDGTFHTDKVGFCPGN
jgi:hypothetical protein